MKSTSTCEHIPLLVFNDAILHALQRVYPALEVTVPSVGEQ